MRLTRPPLSYIPLLPVLSGIVAGVLCARFLPVGPWLMAGVAVASAFVGVLLRRSVLVEILLSAALGVAAVAISVPVSLDGPGTRYCARRCRYGCSAITRTSAGNG